MVSFMVLKDLVSPMAVCCRMLCVREEESVVEP
jgi:hypothetical protein